MSSRGHQRAHLRAPFNAWVLYGDDDFVHRAHARNISEGGILLDEVPQYPAQEETPIMFMLPDIPRLKDFELPQLRHVLRDPFPATQVRARCFLSRRTGETSTVEEVFRPTAGLRFTRLGEADKAKLANYVEIFTANLIYLQMLMDSWNTNQEIKLKARLIAELLGYSDTPKMAQLRARVASDYRSLQWL